MERSLAIVIRWFSESSGDAKDILKKELTTAAPLYRVSSGRTVGSRMRKKSLRQTPALNKNTGHADETGFIQEGVCRRCYRPLNSG